MSTRAPEVLAIVGGSSAFTPALAAALAASEERLPPLVVRLHGRDPAHLEPVRRFCGLVAAERGARHAYEATTDLSAAVTGARVVLNQMRVGGLAARSRDETFPLEFGLPGDETIGPAGLASAIRSADGVARAAKTAAAVAPGAWFVNLTNPLGVLTTLLQDVAGVRAIGLCELPHVTLRRALASIGEPARDVDADYAGVNHQGWFTRIAVGGRDLLPRIVAALGSGAGGWLPVDASVVAGLGALPLPYLRLYYHTDRVCRELFARGSTRGAELAGLSRRLYEHYATSTAAALPPALAQRDMPWIGEAIVPALVALFGGPAAELYVSEKNGTHLPFLPRDAVVEKRCMLGADGLREIRPRSEPPPAVLEMLRAITRYERAAAAAARAPDKDHAIAALREHPLTRGRGDLGAIADAVLAAAGVRAPAIGAAHGH